MPRMDVPERVGEASPSATSAIPSAHMQALRNAGAHRALQDRLHDRRTRAFLAWMQAAPQMLTRSR